MDTEYINQQTLWTITQDGLLLTHVEDFLINVGEPCLQQRLNKLTRDAGVGLAYNLFGREDTDNPSHHEKLALIRDHHPITTDRLKIFDEVQIALEAYDSEYVPAYEQFLANMKSSVPALQIVAAPKPPAPSL